KTIVAESGQTITGVQGGNVTAADHAVVSFNDVSQVAGSVSATLGSSFTFNGGPTTIQGGVYGMPSSLTIFNNDVLIQGHDTAQQGNYALSGVQNQMVFNGNTVINGPVLGNGSSFLFSITNSTSIGALTLAAGSQIGGGS